MRTKELEESMQLAAAIEASEPETRSFGDEAARILAAEVRRLEEDKARLDWMESLQQWPDYHDGLWHNPRTLETFDTLRAAIDAATKGGKP